MYAIVVFDNEMKTEYIPFNWIINKIELQEVSMLVRQRIELKCYWPPWSNSGKVSRAQKQCSEPEIDWKTYSIRLLAVAGNEKEACEKVTIAEETSNVEENFTKQKRKVKEDLIESTDSESKYSNRKKKKISEKLPKPVIPERQSGVCHFEIENSGLLTPVLCTESSEKEVQHRQNKTFDLQSESVVKSKDMSGIPGNTSSPLLKTFGYTTSAEKLLLKILAAQEEIRETQKLHSAMLHSIQQQINFNAWHYRG
ncbi:uncharacterized protein LOC124807255 isoform X2 [Hydra vulgaris]|uniref:uncharacterized protein LOC124807255 isoform X2 n=1 Tax=Hydra vulgaris TaxID=6087 RepID=UPI001F5EA54F|nr:uncharacterized protein LOC124807255 isoform X3 [Hydra vulgaris]